MRRYGRRQRQVRLLKGLVSNLRRRADTGLTFADLGAKRYVLGGSTLYLLLGRHVERISSRFFAKVTKVSFEEEQLDKYLSVVCRGSASLLYKRAQP